MNCLKGYIGLKGCGNTVPPSNRYVNSLPGISLKVLDNLASSEQVTYANVWEAVQERAIANFSNKVTALFAERYRLKKVLSNIDLGEAVNTNDNQTTAAAEYRGFTYELSSFCDKKPSALLQFYVQTLSIYLKSTGDFTITIFDLDLKKQIYTKTVTGGIVGWNSVNVYQCFSGQRFFVCYDSTAIESVYQPLTDYALSCCNECTSSILGTSCTGCLNGAIAATGDAYSVTKHNNTFGLSGVFSLLCSFDNVVCKNLKAFETAYWYGLGEEIMIERLSSPRANLTTIDTKDAEQQLQYFREKFELDLANAVKAIDLDLSDCCIECNSHLTYQESRM